MTATDIAAPAASINSDRQHLAADALKQLVQNGYASFLRPCAPPGVYIHYRDGSTPSVGKVPAQYSTGKWWGFKGWRTHAVTDRDIVAWSGWPGVNVGLVTGDVCAIDIDIKISPEDLSPTASAAREYIAAIEGAVADAVGRRVDELARRTRPNSTSRAIFLRASDPDHKCVIDLQLGAVTGQVEFLGAGQQVVVKGVHETGATQASDLTNVRFDELPVITPAKLSALRDRIAALAENFGFKAVSESTSTPPGATKPPRTEAEIVWREVWRRRAEWVQHVIPIDAGLVDGEWSISSEDLERDLQERLAINLSWCHDFGSERSHTPISFICEFGRVAEDGEIEFGGCPTYGAANGQPYAAIGEPDERVRRPTEAEAFRWLIERLGSDDAAAPDAADVGALARALGLAEEAMTSELARTVFDQFDEAGDVVELVQPAHWTAKQIEANRSRLPILRAIDPTAFAGYVEAWDLTGQALPAEVEATIAVQIELTRSREPSVKKAPSAPASAANLPRMVSGLVDVASIPVRPWLVDSTMPIGAVTTIVGEPGVSKSTLAIQYGLAVATGREDILRGRGADGRPLSSERLHHAGAVIIYNAEDTVDEMSRRLAVLQRHHGVTVQPHGIALWSGVDSGSLVIAERGETGRLQRADGYRKLRDFIVTTGAKLVVLDPQVGLIRGANENDAEDMDFLFQVLSQLAAETGCAIVVVHHTSKKTRNEAGDMGAGRGSFAAAGKVRSMLTFTNVTGKGVGEDKWGVTPEDRLVRLDAGKNSYGPDGSGRLVAVFRRISKPVGNGTAGGDWTAQGRRAADAMFDDEHPRAALERMGDAAPVLEMVDVRTLAKAAREKDETEKRRQHGDDAKAEIARIVAKEMGVHDEVQIADVWDAVGDRLRQAGLVKATKRAEITNNLRDALEMGVRIETADGAVLIRAVCRRPLGGRAGGRPPWMIERTSCPADASTGAE